MGTSITQHVEIAASPAQVWAVLADLERLAEYDPVVTRAVVVGDRHDGIGARRRCDARQGRYFVEDVTVWEPASRLQFRIVECNLPTAALTHSYALAPIGDGTRVTETMEYTMKFGPLGALLDVIVVRRTTTQGIAGFLAGLQRTVEAEGAR